MYIYMVKHTKPLNYVGHGIYNEAVFEHGIYIDPVKADREVERLQKEEGIEAYVERKWIDNEM